MKISTLKPDRIPGPIMLVFLSEFEKRRVGDNVSKEGQVHRWTHKKDRKMGHFELFQIKTEKFT
jgi:hypothetical protein